MSSRSLNESQQSSSRSSEGSLIDPATEAENSLLRQAIKRRNLRCIVFGGLDGIITSFSVIACVVGAQLDIGIVLIMGFTSLIADAISMGMSDFLNSRANIDYTLKQKENELGKYDCSLHEKKKALVLHLKRKGITDVDAKILTNILSKYKHAFVDTVLIDELGLMPIRGNESPAKSGLLTFFSFIFFGLIPLIVYLISILIFKKTEAGIDIFFGISSLLTLMLMFILGALSSQFSSLSWWKSGLFMLGNGGMAATAAFLLGFAFAFAAPVLSTTNHWVTSL